MNAEERAQSIASEHALIGCLMARPGALDAVPTELEADDFLDTKTTATWCAIMNLVGESTPIDPFTVEAELARVGKLESVGGLGALGQWALDGMGWTDELVSHIAKGVHQRGLGRRVRLGVAQALEAATRDDADGDESIDSIQAVLNRMSVSTSDGTVSIGKGTARLFEELQRLEDARQEGKPHLTGLPTGVERLDALIGGWQVGIVQLIVGRPAMGKSSMLLASMDACSSAGHGAHLFTLEDSLSSHAGRALSRDSHVPASDIRAMRMNPVQFHEMGAAAKRLRDRKGWIIDETAGVTATEIVRRARKHQRENATRVVVVDYLGLVKWSRRAEAHEAMEEVLAEFQVSAKNDGLAYVVAHQLNRNVEKRDDRRPVLSDLRDCGEEKPKIIVGMYRGAYYFADPRPGIDWDPDAPAESSMPRARPSAYEFQRSIQLCVIKNNQGPTGNVYATWDAPTTRIS